MDTQKILIVSERPLVYQGLKKIIQETMPKVSITVSGEQAVKQLVKELGPVVVLVDRASVEAARLDDLFSHLECAVKVIVIGSYDDQMLVYSRGMKQTANFENLIRAISGKSEE